MRFEKKISEKTQLVKVSFTEQHVVFLYKLLKLRIQKETISHKKLPSIEKHKDFISSKPYRYWFMVKFLDKYYGSVYLTKSNSITIHLIENNIKVYKEVLIFIVNNIKPLKPIRSVRSANYILNFPVNENFYSKVVEDLGGKKIQFTYSIKRISL